MHRLLFLMPLLLTACYMGDDVIERVNPEDILSPQVAQYAVDANYGGFNWNNDPATLDYESSYEYVFDRLPLSASLDKVPWTGSYWPENEGGISHRWQTGEQHDYRLLAPDEIAAASPETIRTLSPVEKYDLYVGAKDWPLTIAVLSATSPQEPSWAGYCHGWAPASMTYEEPRPVEVVGATGIRIPFGSADIKALLTYFEGEASQTSYYSESQGPWARNPLSLGNNCKSSSPDDSNCYDINPAALHVVMANRIGLQGLGLVADVDPSAEKWNQPIFSYQSNVLTRQEASPGASPDAVEELVVASRVAWTVEIEPRWETATPPVHDRQVLYSLELNENREVVGGQWLYQLNAYDFLTYHQTLKALREWDENQDGTPDLSDDDVLHWMQEWFKVIDFAWILKPGSFSETFRQADSGYAFFAPTASSRAHRFDYMAKLKDIYEASISGVQ